MDPSKVAILVAFVAILVLRWLLGMWVGRLGKWSTFGLLLIIMPAALGMLSPGFAGGGASGGWVAMVLIVVGVVLLVGAMAGKLPKPKPKAEEKEAWA